VKSVLDPCEDENDDMEDDEVSLGADSVERDGYSESGTEVNLQYSLILCFNCHSMVPVSLVDGNDS
jgi:hypothetical protein